MRGQSVICHPESRSLPPGIGYLITLSPRDGNARVMYVIRAGHRRDQLCHHVRTQPGWNTDIWQTRGIVDSK